MGMKGGHTKRKSEKSRNASARRERESPPRFERPLAASTLVSFDQFYQAIREFGIVDRASK
jgi:hypothetical protein